MSTLKQIMNYALQHSSKIQQETYYLSKDRLEELLRIVDTMRQDIPMVADVHKITLRNVSTYLIDPYMNDIHRMLSQSTNRGECEVFVVINFTWKKTFENYSVGWMNMMVSYHCRHGQQQKSSSTPQMEFVSKYISSNDNIQLDVVLPERNLLLVQQYLFSKDMMEPQWEELVKRMGKLFQSESTITESYINEVLAVFSSKQYNTRIYLTLGVYTKREQRHDYWVIKMDIAHQVRTHHYILKLPIEQEPTVLLLEKKFTQSNKTPLQRLRSYASKKQLPIYEKTYHLPEESILTFYSMLRQTMWNDAGWFIYESQREWNKMPPFSGIFPIHFGICVEKETFHMALYIPNIDLKVDTFMEVLEKYRDHIRKEFFPEEKYKNSIKRYAMNPSIPIKQEDEFLMPYIVHMRHSILSQNVRNPTIKNLPTHLSKQIQSARQLFKNELRQHFRRYPENVSKLDLHKSYVQQIQKVVQQRKKEQQIQKYVYRNPSSSIPEDHPFKQAIVRQRQELRKELDEYDTAEDMVEAILNDLNLIDPISSTAIRNPVRSPHNPTGIYQQQSLRQWLSRSSIDPISRISMSKQFQPKVDEDLRKFIVHLEKKISEIMDNDQWDDFKKKIKLWQLKQHLEKKNTFQTVIKKKQQEKTSRSKR